MLQARSVNDALHTSQGEATSLNVAEASRPWRELKRKHQEEQPVDQVGRKRTRELEPAMRVNWQSPLLWDTILCAAAIVGYGMSPKSIEREVKMLDPAKFKALTPQVIGQWIDRTGTCPRWTDKVLDRVKRGARPEDTTTRKSILSPYPDVISVIVKDLCMLRKAGTALDITRCRGLIIAHLQNAIPHIFDHIAKDGSSFRCTESWVKKFLFEHLHWSFRRATRAAQKLPDNADECCLEQFLRLALTIHDCAIFHPSFYVNIDQTNVIYQPANTSTYEVKGSKQVAVLGQDEKQAFTTLVGISAAGDALPFQIIYCGKTKCSLPATTSAQHKEAQQLGFEFCFSNTDTYWSTFDLMCSYVSDILVPYWTRQKELVGAPPDQECLLQLDVWSVHKSIAFWTWLNDTYPWIKYRFVPGNCTGIAQPCDVGVQRPFKLAVKRSQHADIVNEALTLLRRNQDTPSALRLDTTLPTLRDRSVQWLLNGYHAINKPEIIKQVCFYL